jgi:hypothetical protein
MDTTIESTNTLFKHLNKLSKKMVFFRNNKSEVKPVRINKNLWHTTSFSLSPTFSIYDLKCHPGHQSSHSHGLVENNSV